MRIIEAEIQTMRNLRREHMETLRYTRLLEEWDILRAERDLLKAKSRVLFCPFGAING